jgi:hypothetical protein
VTAHVLILANSEYEDTPYDRWLPPGEFALHLLVAEARATGYVHLPDVQPFAAYPGNGGVEWTALGLARRHRPIAVLARGEVDVLRAARLREACDLPGQRPDSARCFRDKRAMKERLRAAGVPVARFAVLDSALDLHHLIEECGYPVVVKPRAGSGSVDTTVVRDEAEALALLRDGPWYGFLAEEFVPGPMYHVDGLVVDGRVVFACASRYVNDCLAWQGDRFMGSVVLDAGPLEDRLVDFAERVLAAMPALDHATFHAELFHTPDDRLVLCEIASRTGGGCINRAIAAARGVDLDREWARVQCGLAPELPAAAARPAAGFTLIPPRRGILHRLPGEPPPPWVCHQRLDGVLGRQYRGGEKSGHFLAAYVVTGDSEATVAARVGEVAAWFDAAVQWSE